MPTAPPVFMKRERKPWAQPSKTADNRARGRKGVEQRKRRLLAEPLCRHCRAKGILRPSTVPDHIIPLAQGGDDDDGNIQCLCDDCHKIKSAAETSKGAANHPLWLEPSAIPLTIVSGPPASGKTTYVKQRAAVNDIIIDLDGIMTRLKPDYSHWSGLLDSQLFDSAIRERNHMLSKLKGESGRSAWFIISAPTEAERRWWQDKLGGQTVLLHPGSAECKRRAVERGTPNAVAGVERWERASRMPWSPPTVRAPRAAIGADGWPVQ